MSYHDGSTSGPYYAPEAYGLSVLGAVDSLGSYEFDMFCVWTDSRGRLYWAEDGGDSRHVPFERYRSRADLMSGTKADLARAVDAWVRGENWGDWLAERRAPYRRDLVDLVDRSPVGARR